MIVYLVYSVSKSGTTSLFKTLTDNRKFPVVQTHDDFMNIGIHDDGTGFADRIRKEFAEFVRPNYEFDDQIDWCVRFDSVSLYFEGDRSARQRFVGLLQSRSLRIATPMRDPVARANSAMLHWMDVDAIDSLYGTVLGKRIDLNDIKSEDLDAIKHGAVKKLLEAYATGSLDEKKTNELYTSMFGEGQLSRDYVSVFYNLASFFWFNVRPLDEASHEIYENRNRDWEMFYFRIERLDSVMPALYEFLGIDRGYEFPRAREGQARKRLLFRPPNMKCEFLKRVLPSIVL